MSFDENPRWLEIISLMQRLEPSMGDDSDTWWTEAVQNLADVLTCIEGKLSREDFAVLVGVGSMMIREANKENGALLQAWQALGIVRSVRRDGGGA